MSATQKFSLETPKPPTQGPQRIHPDDLGAIVDGLQKTRVGSTYNAPITVVGGPSPVATANQVAVRLSSLR